MLKKEILEVLLEILEPLDDAALMIDLRNRVKDELAYMQRFVK